MKRIVLIPVLLFAASSAYCESNGWYAGASLGRAHYQETCDGIRSRGFIGSCDDVDLGWRVWAGRELTDHLGVELGYVDFGNVQGTRTPPGAFDVDGSIHGWTLHGVLSWPVNDEVAVFGKAGLIVAKVAADTSTGFHGRDTDIAPGAGAGVTYRLTDQLNLRAEWEFFGKVGDPSITGDDTVDLMSVGLEYHY